jgi:DNA (cytosine-5)-methyltransferase 1
MTFGSLFAGIGGFDLGLERAGMTCQWQVEIDPFCQRVLAQHWPDVSRYGDIRDCGKHNLATVDVLCGGFPCQDISQAGRRVGITGRRSGLWGEFARIIGELRPRHVIVENSSALLGRGFDRVLGDLAALRYDAEWDVIPACAFGAPHARERVFLVAHAYGTRWSDGVDHQSWDAVQPMPTHWEAAEGQCEWVDMERWLRTHFHPQHIGPDSAEIFGMDDGVSPALDAARVHACGNAIIPQIAEWIGRRLMEVEDRA